MTPIPPPDAVRVLPFEVFGDDLYVAIANVYAVAFAEPPYNEGPEDVERFAHNLKHHRQEEGFVGMAAGQHDELLGFGYGFTIRPGGEWHDTVADAVAAPIAKRLDGAFAFMELAIRPNHQREGLGRFLHAMVMGSVDDHRWGVVTTVQDNNPAVPFYEKLGWTVWHRDFIWPAGGPPYVVLGYEFGEEDA